MRIVFTENYHDKDAENSDDGSMEVFTANREYPVKDSFGKSMIKSKKAFNATDLVTETFKKKED